MGEIWEFHQSQGVASSGNGHTLSNLLCLLVNSPPYPHQQTTGHTQDGTRPDAQGGGGLLPQQRPSFDWGYHLISICSLWINVPHIPKHSEPSNTAKIANKYPDMQEGSTPWSGQKRSGTSHTPSSICEEVWLVHPVVGPTGTPDRRCWLELSSRRSQASHQICHQVYELQCQYDQHWSLWLPWPQWRHLRPQARWSGYPFIHRERMSEYLLLISRWFQPQCQNTPTGFPWSSFSCLPNHPGRQKTHYRSCKTNCCICWWSFLRPSHWTSIHSWLYPQSATISWSWSMQVGFRNTNLAHNHRIRTRFQLSWAGGPGVVERCGGTIWAEAKPRKMPICLLPCAIQFGRHSFSENDAWGPQQWECQPLSGLSQESKTTQGSTKPIQSATKKNKTFPHRRRITAANSWDKHPKVLEYGKMKEERWKKDQRKPPLAQHRMPVPQLVLLLLTHILPDRPDSPTQHPLLVYRRDGE